MKKVRKAVIPAAGLGTRFLPVTKSVPKEMLPVVDTPILYYVIREAVRAGIEDIVLVAGRGKSAIEDFFDVSYEVQDKLSKDHKEALLEKLHEVQNMANIISVRQKHPLGLGHAVLCGQHIVGDEPFAVLLADEIMLEQGASPTVTGQLVNLFKHSGLSAVAVMEVAPSEVSKYGIIEIAEPYQQAFRVQSVVEKPAVGQAPSRWALPGRYVFTADVFAYLAATRPGKNGEIQLTDAMTELAQKQGLLATAFVGKRYDAGDKLGYLMANIELGLQHPEIGTELRRYLEAQQWKTVEGVT